MQLVGAIAELRRQVAQWRREGERIALVPTMGNLHAGHLQLVAEARARAERVLASIFVNPLQFSDAGGGDFDRYPRTLAEDRDRLREAGVDLLFTPPVETIYPDGLERTTRVEVPGLSEILCGEYRPGHFVGVATIVAKLFNLAQPDIALFGEKDYQQLLVIRRLARDLCFPVEVVGVPTVREPSGLALSSRNQYLDAEQRARAAGLYRALCRARERLQAGEADLSAIEMEADETLRAAGFRPEYFSVRRAGDLLPPQADDHELVILAAAWLGEARLIDNLRLTTRPGTP